ncbi:hypothetical protein [Stygiolobus sp. RP850M]
MSFMLILPWFSFNLSSLLSNSLNSFSSSSTFLPSFLAFAISEAILS